MVLGVESGVRDSPELLACVMYLMEEVVPSHHKWRYTQTGLIDRMGEGLLKQEPRAVEVIVARCHYFYITVCVQL